MERYEKLERNPIKREEEILAFWREHDVFAQSLEATKDGPRYVFFEGPPTANGRPHFGHLMPRVYKDLFPRYKTMQGFYVGRKGGWDTHGLPVELEVEKEIGVDSKPEIEAYGVEKFVERCKASVWKYKADWERMIERMGFWIDLENAYVTYTDNYIETVWWELKTMFDRGLLYQGHKTLPYCPRCGTGLSSHEVAQGYRLVQDPSVTIRMPIVSDEDAQLKLETGVRTSLLAWTTTPWTLPANVAVAVSSSSLYVEVEQQGERLIVAKELAEKALDGEFRVVREVRGEELVGLRYQPPYVLTDAPTAYRAYPAGFVNMEDGTGIVHIASAFGEDDYQLGQEFDLPFVQPVTLAGTFIDESPICPGEFVKDADPKIIDDLRQRDVLYRQASYEHDYPFCWRCDTPLLYYAMDSWYIRTTAVKQEMIEQNRTINWYPAHVGEGRLGDFLANLKDWALSRDRYWGTPLPLWVCESCGETTAIGSRQELVERAIDAKEAADVELHRPYVDRITVRCSECGGEMKRVPYVIDTWFDSGSMHSAQWHYPFENEDRFHESFPADFICEAMEQTRGWFYTLLATSTILHGKAPYRNCIGTGLGLDENGLKMSKSKGNVLDPWDVINAYGADCTRWYLYSSSAPWKSKRLAEADVKDPLYRFLDTLRNTHDFFALYASIDAYDPVVHDEQGGEPALIDRWIRSRTAGCIEQVVSALDVYDVTTATGAIEQLVEDLSNWYVRLSRRRFWKGGMGPDKIAAYATLRAVLLDLARLCAPFIPFISECLYRSLRTEDMPESVHLAAYPIPDTAARDEALDEAMIKARSIAALGHQARNEAQTKVRQPLASLAVESDPLPADVESLLCGELNVAKVEWVASIDHRLDRIARPNFRTLGPRVGSRVQGVAEWIQAQPAEELLQRLADGEPIDAIVDGEPLRLEAEDVTFEPKVPDGFVCVQQGAVRLLLDVRLTDELKEQGWVRELAHRIQLLRKEAGFDVTDRIEVGYDDGSPVAEVVAKYRDALADEVLASSIEPGLFEGSNIEGELDINGRSITVALRSVRAGAM